MQQNIYDDPNFFKHYRQLRKTKYNFNTLLEQPALKSLLPDLCNLKVLDIGCGMGGFAKYCIEIGAQHVTAIDISKNMLLIAQSVHAHPKIDFYQQSLEHFEAKPSSFDCIASSLVLHYISDFHALIGKITTILRPNGVLIFSVEHPIVTARKEMESWIYDKDGNRCHYAIDDYQDEGLRKQTWFVEGVEKYHRTMSTIINTLIAHGLAIEKVIEPIPDREAIQTLSSLEKELRRPSFLLVKARK
ncbi:class I SAM-dependent methyltransferase [Lysinibacillus sphaericus]|uniref:class I SAM-dependent methyltransferase n=1 Tax=Lysinibacillus sphaericus TaxID=1421 RepID=UPI003CFE57EE